MIKKIILNMIISGCFLNSAHGALTAPSAAAAAAAAGDPATPLLSGAAAGSGYDSAVPAGAGLGGPAAVPGAMTLLVGEAAGSGASGAPGKEAKRPVGEFAVYRTVMPLVEAGTKEALETLREYKEPLEAWYKNEYRLFRESFHRLMADGPENTKGDPFSRAVILAVSSKDPAKKVIYREMIDFLRSTLGSNYFVDQRFPAKLPSHDASSLVGPIRYAAEHGESELVLLLRKLGFFWLRSDGLLNAPMDLNDAAKDAITKSKDYVKMQEEARTSGGNCSCDCGACGLLCLALAAMLASCK